MTKAALTILTIGALLSAYGGLSVVETKKGGRHISKEEALEIFKAEDNSSDANIDGESEDSLPQYKISNV